MVWGLNVLSAYIIPEGRFADADFIKRSKISSGELNVNLITFDQYNRMWLFSDGYGIAVFDRHYNQIKSFRAELASRQKKNESCASGIMKQLEITYLLPAAGGSSVLKRITR